MNFMWWRSLVHNAADKIAGKSAAAREAEENDRSYDDALFDLQIRSCLRADYAKDPPANSFQKLASRIRAAQQSSSASATPLHIYILTPLRVLGRALHALYTSASRPSTIRFISGGLAAMLLVTALWPSMIRTLDGGRPALSFMTPRTTLNSQPATPRQSAPSQQSTVGLQVAPVQSAPTPAAQQNITPGLMYEQPRLRVELKTGEDLGAASFIESPADPDTSTPSKKDVQTVDPGQMQTCNPNQLCVN